ncbi:TPA: hypothetical protein L6B02_28570 [Pseudomonas aeruginosa]|nr:hypothetical protein [Pseudomonas aeruginosa]
MGKASRIEEFQQHKTVVNYSPPMPRKVFFKLFLNARVSSEKFLRHEGDKIQAILHIHISEG